MAVHQYTAGARTRNVVNIAQPGGTVAAYAAQQAALAVPTAATDGFKNLHSQKNLHIVVHNNGLEDGGVAMTVTATVYVYNSSLGGKWAPLTLPINLGASDGLDFKNVATPPVANTGTTSIFRAIVPIEGAERIAVATAVAGGGGVPDGGNYSIWLGVNTI